MASKNIPIQTDLIINQNLLVLVTDKSNGRHLRCVWVRQPHQHPQHVVWAFRH